MATASQELVSLAVAAVVLHRAQFHREASFFACDISINPFPNSGSPPKVLDCPILGTKKPIRTGRLIPKWEQSGGSCWRMQLD
jgi:hypothetical protein